MTKKIAFLFPGQGSQAVGMLDSFKQDESTTALYSKYVNLADTALGEPLSSLIAEGPAEQLNLTVNTQPAMLLADCMAYAAYIQAGGPTPSLVAGHSLGEYAALVAAGGLSLEDGLRVVRARAQAMQSAVPVGEGGMAAILGLDDPTVLQLCAKISAEGDLVEAVNFNAPAQVVAAGTASGIEKLCAAAKGAGAKRALPLPVSAPFHSSLLKPASIALAAALDQAKVTDFSTPLITNVDVLEQITAEKMKDSLVRQAYSPVRWVETIQKMEASGIELFVECGPGKVLSGLVKRISSIPVLNISNAESVNSVIESL